MGKPTGIAALVLWLLFGLLPITTSAAADVTPPASERFAESEAAEVPDFQRHVVPLLGRLGCNGRSCHGSFQGRGGFRLSLFGYDFAMDHAALTAPSGAGEGLRVDLDNPEQSLTILKPSLQIDHEGGERFPAGSWEHHLLRQWIRAGATGVSTPRELSRLEIEPAEVIFGKKPHTVPLRVIAVWQDGHREDVTPLCRFRTNDDSVVTVDPDGRLASVGPGDTHVIAFYDNGVAAVPVMCAVSQRPESDRSPSLAAGPVDELVLAKLDKLGIVPSDICSDSEFLRRVSIDLTGTLPTRQVIRS